MEKLFKKYFEESKKNISKLRDLKKLFVKHQQFEIANKVRDIEQELYPISEADLELIKEAKSFKIALGVADININEEGAFLVLGISKMFLEKKLEFDLRGVSKLKALLEKLYK